MSFDREAALHAAMLLFWLHGYEATSLSALTAAMGISPPSLYAAFGDKKALFLEAVGRYLSGKGASEKFIADAPSAHAAAWGLLSAAALGYTQPGLPKGCLLASAAISASPAAAEVVGELAGIRRGIEARLRDKIFQAMQAGALPSDCDAEALAGHVMAVIQGLSTLARDGATREKLLRVAQASMRAWPGQKPSRRRARALGR